MNLTESFIMVGTQRNIIFIQNSLPLKLRRFVHLQPKRSFPGRSRVHALRPSSVDAFGAS